jgi:hypothetical protein
MAKTRLVVDLTEIEFIGLTAQARASGLTVENHVRQALGAEKVEIKARPARKRAPKAASRKRARRAVRRKGLRKNPR